MKGLDFEAEKKSLTESWNLFVFSLVRTVKTYYNARKVGSQQCEILVSYNPPPPFLPVGDAGESLFKDAQLSSLGTE